MPASVYGAEDLRPGLKVSYDREITEEDILAFAKLSGDSNPLHVDDDYAKQTNYQGRIVHGAFQVGLASALLGMHLPGQNVLLGSINSRFPSPLRYPARVKVTGEITSWNRQALAGQLKVIIQEVRSFSATAEISMGFTLHEGKKSGEALSHTAIHKAIYTNGVQRRIVVVTGASGGLGAAIVAALVGEWDVLALVNRHPLPDGLSSLPNVLERQIDLTAANMEDCLLAYLEDRRVYGIIHAAWPGAPRGGLMHADDETIRSQMDFGTILTVKLARFLFEHGTEDGGRFIAIGSTAGTFKPSLPLGVYSFGKACLENAIRLLAPELARRKITINAACPSFVPVGINKEADRRRLLQESAAVPLGRLCQTEDVVGMIRYLLSSDASFVSGQILALTGAQL